MRTLTKEQKVIHITKMSCKFLGSLNFAFTLFLLFFAGNQSVLSDFDTKSYDWSTAKELRTGILHAKAREILLSPAVQEAQSETRSRSDV